MAAIKGPIDKTSPILFKTGKVKFCRQKNFELDNKDIKLERLLQNMRKLEEYYSVTDDKFNKEEFEKKVRKNRLITKGIEVVYILFGININQWVPQLICLVEKDL